MTIYNCNGCDYTTNIKTHMLNHVDKATLCIEFPDGPRYTSEKRKKEKKIHSCKKCDKEFTTSSNRKRHEENCTVPVSEPVQELPEPEQEYIYLIQLYPYNENIHKLGRTYKFNQRMSSYKNVKPMLKFAISCLNSVKCEFELLKIFSSVFTQDLTRGSEYFKGCSNKMILEIIKYFNKCLEFTKHIII